MSQQPLNVGATVRRMATYLRPHWKAQLGAVLASLVTVGAELPAPLLIKALVDDVAIGGDLSLLPPLLIALGALAIVGSIAAIAANYLFTSAGEQAANVLRRALMDQVLRLPLAYFRGHRTGDTVTHFTADSAAIAEAYERAYGNGLAAAISVLGIVIVVAVIDWRFGVLAAVLVPVYMLLPRLRQGHHVRSAQRVQAATGELGGLATELIAGMRDIRAFNRQAWSLERLRRLLRALRDARVYEGFVVGWTWVTTTIFWIAYASIFFVLAEPIFDGEVTIGFALALAGYLSWLNREVTPLTMAYVDLLHAVGAARRLFNFLDTPAEDDAGDGTPLAITRGDVEFRGVGASYISGIPVLTDVSFRAPSGSTTAIVGPSGAGKSTVVNLLLRFLQPSAGEIRLDGQDVGAVSATEVRRHVGVVFQDPVLFHGSIADNIGFGREGIGQHEVARASDIAAAADFIGATRDGFDTQVGERGLRLSGGQAQRIAIARAIAGDPRVLVLDEATSALDAEAEHLVLRGLERAREGRTTLVVAHRLSTVHRADQVVVLDEGHVLDVGRHDELYERCGLYRELCDRQMQPSTGVRDG